MDQVGIILVQLLTLIFGNFFCTLFGVCKHSNFQFVCKHFFLLQIWLKHPRSQASHPYVSNIFTFIKSFFLIRNGFFKYSVLFQHHFLQPTSMAFVCHICGKFEWTNKTMRFTNAEFTETAHSTFKMSERIHKGGLTHVEVEPIL